jgi:hypothetical protein
MKLSGIAYLSLAVNLLLSSSGAMAEEGSQMQRYMQGSKLWQQNCARCHNLRRPENYTDRQWEIVVHHMRLRAGLTGEETAVLAGFLKAIN